MKNKDDGFLLFVYLIINRWNEKGFKYHNGHVNILKYSYTVFQAWKADHSEKMNFQLILLNF